MTGETAKPPGAARQRAPRLAPGGRIGRASDFLNLELDTRVRLIAEMSPLECAQLFHDWAFWARPDQAPPDGDWIIWLILAGRGAGKTRAGARRCAVGQDLSDRQPDRRHRRRRPRHHGEGKSGILDCCRRDERPASSPSTFGSNGRTAQ